MRTWFEIEETDGYLTARETLLRRCGAWAAARGLVMAPPQAGALLDSRHFSPDGRLGYWTPAQVERALLHWIPGKVTAPPEDLLGAPQTLRSLLRYLETTGLRDPRGATTAENEAAIDSAAAGFSAAIADPDRYGLAKTMALAAGLDKPEAIEAFLQEGPGTVPGVDPRAVQAAMARQARLPALNAERKMPQLPVSLPAGEELAASAGRSKVAGQFRALAEWLGPQGRELTSAKNIRPADARHLIALLGTGDEGLKFRSAAELPGLNLVVSWALRGAWTGCARWHACVRWPTRETSTSLSGTRPPTADEPCLVPGRYLRTVPPPSGQDRGGMGRAASRGRHRDLPGSRARVPVLGTLAG